MFFFGNSNLKKFFIPSRPIRPFELGKNYFFSKHDNNFTICSCCFIFFKNLLLFWDFYKYLSWHFKKPPSVQKIKLRACWNYCSRLIRKKNIKKNLVFVSSNVKDIVKKWIHKCIVGQKLKKKDTYITYKYLFFIFF